jgi:membrane fusion protein (multidrug efflux system)
LVVTRRTIESGNTRDGRVGVISGLESGEQVVAKGLLRLRSGQQVTIVEEASDSAEASE